VQITKVESAALAGYNGTLRGSRTCISQTGKTGFTSEEVEHLPSYDGPIVHGVRFGENVDLGGSVNSFIGLGAVYPVVG
jgi:hypothetical protein